MTDARSSSVLRPPWLHVARVVWVALISSSALMFILALPPRYAQLLADPYGMRLGLQQMGLTVKDFAFWGLALDVFVAAVFLGFAVLLFARLSREWLVMLFSLGIGMFAILGLPVTNALTDLGAAWQFPQVAMRAVGFLAFYASIMLFPNGRFVPRWSWLVLLVIGIYSLLWVVFPQLAPLLAMNLQERPSAISVVLLAGAVILLVAFQVYRYRFVSSSTQRQQTRWVLLGILIELTNLILVVLTGVFLTPLRVSSLIFTIYYIISIAVVLLTMLVLPLTVSIAILRYRLWDIDALIRRVLVYGLLGVALGLVATGLTIFLRSLFTPISHTPTTFSVVLSILLTYLLYNPLRRRFQDFIDQRFYRRKYAAEKALAEFAAAARSETNLESLSTKLLSVVTQSVQPSTAGLWLTRKQASPNENLSNVHISKGG